MVEANEWEVVKAKETGPQHTFLQYLLDREDSLAAAYRRYKMAEEEEADKARKLTINGAAAHLYDTVAEIQNAIKEYKKIHGI